MVMKYQINSTDEKTMNCLHSPRFISLAILLLVVSLLPLSAQVGFKLPPFLPEVLLTPAGAAVPLQPLATLAGLTVTRDLLSGVVTVARQGHTFTFSPYATVATSNGTAVTLPVAPVERHTVLYLPLQPLIDALAGTVKSTAEGKQPNVTISLPGLAQPLVLPTRQTPDSLATLSYSLISLYLMNSDGSGLHRLTFNFADNGIPVLAPDSKSWAYIYDGSLYLRPTSNSAPLCLCPSRTEDGNRVVCTHPFFSKDGTSLFFMEQKIIQTKGWWTNPAESHICRVDIAGGTKTILAKGRDLCASRDGSCFVYGDDLGIEPPVVNTEFMPDVAAPGSVHVLDATGKELTTFVGQNPTLSPDGTRVGLCVLENGHLNAKIYRLHGELAGTLPEAPESKPWTGRFSPDSQSYICNDGKLGMRLTNAELKNTRILTPGQNVVAIDAQFSPDGTQVFFNEPFSTQGWPFFNSQYGLFSVQTDGTGFKQLTRNLYVTEYTVSADGKQILFAGSVQER